MSDSIKIMVRCRPFNQRELEGQFKNIVEMEGQEVRLTNPGASGDKPRKFGFHRAYYSTDDSMGHPPVDNHEVFNDVGKEVLDQIYQGYNATIFAYGQTGSGKSFSIQGKEPHTKGLLQMCLDHIFNVRKEENGKKGLATSVKVTYLEIYNEKLRDLVNPNSQKQPRVIQMGTAITVSNVDYLPVTSYQEVLKVFEEGKKVRVVGSTKMNNTSSRSHAIFTIHYKQTGKGKMIDAKFNIVDLAGSERQSKTGATGQRLKQANNINASLTNLGIVIEKLADNCVQKKTDFIPYRNSVLTHILSESLAGNSKTFMIAAISPADDNYEETLGTLRFAQRASKISTKTQKNVSAKEGYNKELLLQIERLKKELEEAKAQVTVPSHSHSVSVQYITIEKEVANIDGRIANMMQELDQNGNERKSVEAQLQQFEQERSELKMEKTKKKLLDPEQETRVTELDSEIGKLKDILSSKDKGKEKLEQQLEEERVRREELAKELNEAKGEVGQQQSKASELGDRIMLMMGEVEQNKADKDGLLKELEEERKMKEEIQNNRKKVLEQAGVSNQESIAEKKNPYMMNVSDDPTLLGMLLYDLKEGETKIGTKDVDENNVKLNVLGIMPRHCSIHNQKGKISIEPYQEAKVFINGTIVTDKKEISHLDRVTLGHANNFKLVVPGKASSADDLTASKAGKSTFGQYIDDKLKANTEESKSMKQFLIQQQQRLDKNLYSKFLESFKSSLQEIDEINDYTFERYRKFPLKTKNVFFRIKVVIDIENYMKSVPEILVACQHKETKEPLFVWNYQKFQKRLGDMESWYQGTSIKDNQVEHHDYDPWFEAYDSYLQERQDMEHISPREVVAIWQKKQAEVKQSFKSLQDEINAFKKEMSKEKITDDIIEGYADYYFRNFSPPVNLKKKIQEMRKNEENHVKIKRNMECYAELQQCKIDNTYFNKQRGKFMKGGKEPPQAAGKTASAQSGSNQAVSSEIVALRAEVSQLRAELGSINDNTDELHEEIKRQAKIIHQDRKYK